MSEEEKAIERFKKEKNRLDKMSYVAEEEKAIERLDYFEPDDLVECAMYRDCVEKIKKLIDKQQKEIDFLQTKIKQNENIGKIKTCMTNNMPNNVELVCMAKEDFERNYGNDYIRRDAIRDFYKKYSKEAFNDFSPYIKDNATPEKERKSGQIKILEKIRKELLGE